MKNQPQETVPKDDMAIFRRSLGEYCSKTHGDFATVNLVVTLRRTVSELTSVLEAYTGDVKVTPGRINILMALDASPEKSMPLSDLGDHLVVTRANITGLIDGLVKDGLVQRLDHPEDRRMVLAELTPKGKKFIAWLGPIHHKLVNKIGNCLDEDEKGAITGWLDCLRKHIQTLDIPQVEPFRE